MKGCLALGDFELIWLDGGRFELDGGTTFGPVPKVLWGKKYPCDAENYVPISAWPVLVKTPQALVVIEAGLGNKLTEKQKQIFRVRGEWRVPQDLASLGLRREDIDYVLLTHYDWDHSAGVVMQEEGELKLTFPRARHVVQRKEWEDVLHPNRRSGSTYWPVNSELLRQSGNLELVDGAEEVVDGIRVLLSGGHTRGHQIITMESRGERAIHLGDLLPTHAHFNPLWITAYDNFPLDSIAMKEQWERWALEHGAWFTLYQDGSYLACRFDEKGNVMEKVEAQERKRPV
ncbi:MAG: MBL fold metallo-hydrolase [Alphaproteobacteria bacterium]|uniref:MBL fold metallo-hydrolase n=1 Tax=Candidatus Nitrobium versatile TaxID=2884831 RepID=A0A953M2J2_9BACT|nr:MBL fold metallo-hydrolase [Candidatus Nitrobium versatile]